MTLNPKPWVLDPRCRGLVIVVVIRVSSKLTDFLPPPPSPTTLSHDSTHPRDSLSVVRHSYRSYGSTRGGTQEVGTKSSALSVMGTKSSALSQ
eukprot:COSAG01_NODE_1963_length_8785_cov_56.285402_9_plen_93_part_00